jgi:hypothetical protein
MYVYANMTLACFIAVGDDARLKKFFDSNKTSIKRAQCLMKFIVVAPEREGDLFTAHSNNIFVVLERSISFYEGLSLKKKETTISSFFHNEQYAEVDEFCMLMKLLSRLIFYCPSRIRDRWNYHPFCRLAGRAIERSNTPALRLVGVETLLLFIENIRPLIQELESKGERVEGSELEIPLLLLEEAVNFNSFYNESPKLTESYRNLFTAEAGDR